MERKTMALSLMALGLSAAASSFAFNPQQPAALQGNDPTVVRIPARQWVPVAAAVPTLPVRAAPNFRAIVQQAAPAVVGITVAGLHQGAAGAASPDPDDPYLRFFRGLPGYQFRPPPPGPRGSVPFRSVGSGFIISSDGLILTNAHVVREAKEVVVTLQDRREFRARVLGADQATDVAVLRIAATGLPTVRLGDPQQSQVGDPVLAIGSPFGFDQTATQGIVSALGRSLPGDASVPFIQTDAAVNPGNSGGPLFDASGAVIGINAQIYSESGGFQGLSFAIPITVALKVKDQIVATGKASHARLGVTAQDLGQSLADSFGLSRPLGALIAAVSPDGAAAKAGLQPGDVVTGFNGEPVGRSGDLSSRISLASPGDSVRLQIWRDHSARDLTVELGGAENITAAEPRRVREDKSGQLGLTLRPLTSQEKVGTRVSSGLVIEGVTGEAALAGLMPGDVLLAINSVPVTSVEQVRSMLTSARKQVALLVLRDGTRVFVAVQVG